MLGNAASNASLSSTIFTPGEPAALDSLQLITAITEDALPFLLLLAYEPLQAILIVCSVIGRLDKQLECPVLVEREIATETHQHPGRVLCEVGLEILRPAKVANGVAWIRRAGGELLELTWSLALEAAGALLCHWMWWCW